MPSAPEYQIEADARTGFMRLTFSGLMDHAIMDRFEQDMATAIARRPAENGRRSGWLFLSDLRTAGIQSRDISERLQSVMAQYRPVTRRTAMVMSGSSLELMQARRVSVPDRTDFFLTEEAALAWLVADSGAAAA